MTPGRKRPKTATAATALIKTHHPRIPTGSSSTCCTRRCRSSCLHLDRHGDGVTSRVFPGENGLRRTGPGRQLADHHVGVALERAEDHRSCLAAWQIGRIVVGLVIPGILIHTYVLGGPRDGFNPFDYFGYFTNPTSLLMSCELVVSGVLGLVRRPAIGVVYARAVLTTCMVIVGVICNALVPGTGMAPAWVSVTLHIVFPVLVLLDWALGPTDLPFGGRVCGSFFHTRCSGSRSCLFAEQRTDGCRTVPSSQSWLRFADRSYRWPPHRSRLSAGACLVDGPLPGVLRQARTQVG